MKFPIWMLFFLLVLVLSPVHQQRIPEPQFFAIGPGIDDPTGIPFSSRYFFLFHRRPILPANWVRIRSKSAAPSRCRLWPQVFNETQFCIWIDAAREEVPGDLEMLLQRSKFCSDQQNLEELSLVQYWMTIVRYALLRDQQECQESLELVVLEPPNSVLYQRDITDGGTLYSELCHCPRDDWPQRMQCNSRANQKLQTQIDRDLGPFLREKTPFNFSWVVEEAETRFARHPQTYAYCWYKIITNQAYKKCYGQYVGFSKFFDQMLLSVMRKTRLGDNQFLVNLGDWPLSDHRHQRLPIFSWCGSRDTDDIVLPTYELTESILESQGRQTVDMLSVFGRQPLPFGKKLNKLFWRGRDSNRARLRLVEHSFQNPDRYDVAITNFFFFRDEMHRFQKSGQNQTYVSFLDFFRYKYQINIDGTVSAYRFPFLLAGNSLVLKQQSPFYEFFYQTILEEWRHYVPVEENLDDLPRLVERLPTETDDRTNVTEIIWNARKTVMQYLLPANIYCYYYVALERYRSELLGPSGHIPILDGTEEKLVQDQDVPINRCNCDTLATTTKDEL